MSVDVEQVAPCVHLCRARDVNWVLLSDGDALTLVDAGYPGDTDDVLASIAEVGGRPEALTAILLTHAHVDHLGAVGTLHERFGTPVLTDPVEVGHARRDHLEQATTGDVVRNLWRRGALPWALRISRNGATTDVVVPHAEPFPTLAGEPLDLPGRPVPVPTHGHTSGHTAYLLPEHGIVLTGDELVTGHPISRVVGPQRLPAFFHHGPGDTDAALRVLADVDADVILPGHGPLWRQPVSDAVAALL